MRSGRTLCSTHLTTWCGFSIDSKRHTAYINFIKYSAFRNVMRSVKHDHRSLRSIRASIQSVLRSRLRAARRHPRSTDDISSQYYLVFCSVLFAVKRALWNRRVMNARRLEELIAWTGEYVIRRTVVGKRSVRWLVNFAYYVLMKNCAVYNKVGRGGGDE